MSLVPELRFPEFQAANEWTLAQLIDALLSISNGLSLPQSNQITSFRVTRIETIAEGSIDLCRIGYVDPTEDISDYKLNAGDILFSNINSVAHIGKNVIVDFDMDLYHGMNLLRLIPNHSAVSPWFVFYLLNTESLRNSFRTRANKAVNQASINQTEVGKTNIYLPELPEQRKIAECLSSLDQLITAERQKLDALKAHKKGLMQQLFPAEGETIPHLRFPEFQDGSSWIERRIGDCVGLISGLHLSPGEYGISGEVPYFTGPTDFTNSLSDVCKWTKNSGNVAHKDDVLITVKGSGVGQLWYLQLPMIAIGRQLMAVRATTCSKRFAYHILQLKLDRFRALASGNLIPGLTRSDILESTAMLPSLAEQEKVADCLENVDSRTKTQESLVNALKTHKAGLMQQLFPSLDEVQA